MTGVYPSDVGSYCNSTVWDGSEPTWATRLSEAGTYCWATGKFDLNPDFSSGFHEVETRNGHYDNPDITSLFRNPPCYRMDERPDVDGRSRENDHHDAILTDHVVQFLKNESSSMSEPWLCWVGMSQPHPRFVAREDYFDSYSIDEIDLPDIREDDLEQMHLVYQALRHFKRVATPISEERVRRARAGYYGMITELDAYVGKIYDALEESGQLEDTVFIYTSDHGESLGEHGLWHKSSLYENASHVPLVIAGPGIEAGRTIDTPVAHVDIAATFFEYAGLDQPKTMRGHSLLPMLRGEGDGDHPGWTYTEAHSEGLSTGGFLIRKGPWKYVHFTYHDDLLFNLDEDPGEFSNRIGDTDVQDVVDELRSILNNEVDTERVTQEAFAAQNRMLEKIAQGKSAEELAQVFWDRLGPGQATLLAQKVVEQTQRE
jgi:choline-sulfatase